jgi:hypothetical protein
VLFRITVRPDGSLTVASPSRVNAFYTEHLRFEVVMQAAGFAMLDRGDLRLLLNRPGAGGAGHTDDAGRLPEPGAGTGSSSGSRISTRT